MVTAHYGSLEHTRVRLDVNSIARMQQGARLTSVYNRLLATISVMDIILALHHLMAPWALPHDGRGTWGTCVLQGSLGQFGFGECHFATGLGIYYLLVIRYNVREETLRKYFEPFLYTTVL